jgi:hypothetical protein
MAQGTFRIAFAIRGGATGNREASILRGRLLRNNTGMRPLSLYSVIVVILPVALGLGLIYLYCVGRINAFTALAAILALGASLAGAAFMARAAEDAQASRGQGGSGRAA